MIGVRGRRRTGASGLSQGSPKSRLLFFVIRLRVLIGLISIVALVDMKVEGSHQLQYEFEGKLYNANFNYWSVIQNQLTGAYRLVNSDGGSTIDTGK